MEDHLEAGVVLIDWQSTCRYAVGSHRMRERERKRHITKRQFTNREGRGVQSQQRVRERERQSESKTNRERERER